MSTNGAKAPERKDLESIINIVYNNDVDRLLDDVEDGVRAKFGIFVTINEHQSNADVLILEYETQLYIQWYKLTHIGRDLHTNIKDVDTMQRFIERFKAQKDKERG